MANVTNQLTNYYATESEIYELFSSQGFKPDFIANFTRDYSAAKRNINIGAGQIDTNTTSLVEVNARVTINTGSIQVNSENIQVNSENIVTLTLRLDNNDILLDGLRSDLDDHTSALQAHGTIGRVVGVGDFAAKLVGGTVFLIERVSDATLSNATVLIPNASSAGATYDQLQINSVVDLANANKASINQMVLDLNKTTDKLNELIIKMRTAKHLELEPPIP